MTRLPIEKLTIEQMRQTLDKLNKNHKGLSKRQMIRLINVLIGQAPLES